MRYRIGICDDEISTCSEIETCIQQRFRNKSDSVEVRYLSGIVQNPS